MNHLAAMWKEFQAMNPNNDAPPADPPADLVQKKKTKKTSAKMGDLKIRIKVPKPKKSKKNSSASEDDFEDDLDFMDGAAEPSKAKRVSSRANKESFLASDWLMIFSVDF